MRHLRYVLVALTLGALAAGPLPTAAAQTAPSYQSSDPAKGAMLDHPPAQVTVTFDQPLDQSSWMNVLDACGKEIDAGPATIDLNEITVDIAGKTPSGNWKVVYKAVGLAGATGSSTSSFEFMVHHGKACSGGKGGHKHPTGGGKKDDDHDDHDKDDGRGHDDHDGGDDGTTGHSGHSDMPGTGGSTHSGHTMGSNADTSGHDDHGNGHGDHDDNGRKPAAPGGGGSGTGPFATGDGNVPVGADGEAVLLGLGLALAVGALGGWLLRLSSGFAA